MQPVEKEKPPEIETFQTQLTDLQHIQGTIERMITKFQQEQKKIENTYKVRDENKFSKLPELPKNIFRKIPNMDSELYVQGARKRQSKTTISSPLNLKLLKLKNKLEDEKKQKF